MDLGAALLGLLTGVLVKLTVMFLAGRLIARVYRATHARPRGKLWLLLPRESLPGIRVLWWALVLFGVSELTCGIEVYVLSGSSAVLAGIHAVTSGLGMGLFVLGGYLYFDRAVVRYGGPRCALNRICGGCTFTEPAGCRYRVALVLFGVLVALAAIPPFFAPTEKMVASTADYLLPFPTLNAWGDASVVPRLQAIRPYDRTGAAFYLPHAELVIEYRVLPAVALLLAVAASALLQARREHLGLRALMLGSGVLAYVYFELVLYRVTGDVMIGSLGHEIVELWFLVVTAEVLARTFSPAPPQASGARASAEPTAAPHAQEA